MKMTEVVLIKYTLILILWFPFGIFFQDFSFLVPAKLPTGTV